MKELKGRLLVLHCKMNNRSNGYVCLESFVQCTWQVTREMTEHKFHDIRKVPKKLSEMLKNWPFFFPLCSCISPDECETNTFSMKRSLPPSGYWNDANDEDGPLYEACYSQPKQKRVFVGDNSPLKATLSEVDMMELIQSTTASDTIHTSDAIQLSYEMNLASLQRLLAEALEHIQNLTSVPLYVRSQFAWERTYKGTDVRLNCQPVQYQSQPVPMVASAKAGMVVVKHGNRSQEDSPSVLDGHYRKQQTPPTTPLGFLYGHSVAKTTSSTTAHAKERGPKTAAGKSCATRGTEGGTLPSSSPGQSHAANNEAGRGGGGASPSSNPGQSHAGNNEPGRGEEVPQPSNSGPSESFRGNNGHTNSSPPSPGKGSHPPYDQPDSSVEVEPSFHQSAELVVQADVCLIRISDRVPDDNDELVLSLPKVIDPGGKSDLVRCAGYTPPIHASQPCSDTSYPKADAHISDAHPNSCNDSISDPSSLAGMIHSAPASEEGDLSSLLYQAADITSRSPLGSSMVAPELPPHKLLQQELISCPQPSSHSLSEASSEIESIDESLYLTEAETAVQDEGNGVYPSLTKYSAPGSPEVAPEPAPCSLSQQGSISCQLPPSDSSSVASTETESGDDGLYLTQAQAAVQGEGNASLLVLTNSSPLPFQNEESAIPPSDRYGTISEPVYPSLQ